ncbi:MAG: helix-turn-helix domain-containing protein, partial [Planctomycetota bacterium]
DAIDVEDLPDAVLGRLESAAESSLHYRPGQTLAEAMQGPEKQIIRQALQDNDQSRQATADQLGINRTTLYKKMRKYGLLD